MRLKHSGDEEERGVCVGARFFVALAALSPTNLWLFPCYTAFSTARAVCVPTLSEKNLILMYETSCMKYIDCVPIYFIHVL